MRLRTVLDRFRQYNITLNPKKCSSSGLEEVEFVGHVLQMEVRILIQTISPLVLLMSST